MTHRPAAPRLLFRARANPAGPAEAMRLRGAPMAAGTSVHLGWDGARLLTLELEGVRPEWALDLAQAVADALSATAAQQQEAAS